MLLRVRNVLLAGACLGVAGCSAGPAELSLQEREVGDALGACLERGLAGVRASSVGPASAGAVLGGDQRAGVETLARPRVRDGLDAAAWARDGKVVVVLGVAKEMVPASTPGGVKALSNQSAMVWEAKGSLADVAGCFEEIAR